jgi:hypothetical protein
LVVVLIEVEGVVDAVEAEDVVEVVAEEVAVVGDADGVSRRAQRHNKMTPGKVVYICMFALKEEATRLGFADVDIGRLREEYCAKATSPD